MLDRVETEVLGDGADGAVRLKKAAPPRIACLAGGGKRYHGAALQDAVQQVGTMALPPAPVGGSSAGGR